MAVAVARAIARGGGVGAEARVVEVIVAEEMVGEMMTAKPVTRSSQCSQPCTSTLLWPPEPHAAPQPGLQRQ